MKAKDLKLNELIEFGEGRITLQGRRMLLHDLFAFAELKKDLLEMVGPDHSRRILTRFGFYWGQADAAAMKRVFVWDSVQELILASAELLSMQGVCRCVIKNFKNDSSTNSFLIEVNWYNSSEIDELLNVSNGSDMSFCWVLAGYMSGYCSFCVDKAIYFIEKSCEFKGDSICSATGMDADSWGQELKSFIGYFKSDDIWGKVKQLSLELKRKSRQLSMQKRLLGIGPSAMNAFFIEVHSEKFRKVIDLATRVAKFDTSVVITGETGSGKEVLARFIHAQSPRTSRPFVAINCAALPESILESELFGHKAGSFTGAVCDHIGLFERANGGTVFLDEIGDISLAMQTKILRVLQEREILRVGETDPRKIDVRIIAATNKNLEQEIIEGRFREDLYYRLRVVHIEIPPLRERKEDILPLARFFISKLASKLKLSKLRLDSKCVDYLLNYDWPGNIRELENAIEYAAVLSNGERILPEHLPQAVVQGKGFTARSDDSITQKPLGVIEYEHIKKVLESVSGNRKKAAKILGIGQATLWRKMKKMGLIKGDNN
jgi:DNA-binding NtrC family response regulator/predicted hydrocarbon binding protein